MTALTDLGRMYGTPSYVYRLDRLRAAAADLRAAVPEQARLYYSVRANPHPDVVAELSGAGLHAKISSVGELESVEVAGHLAERCLYFGPGKTYKEITSAIRRGVRLFSVESAADRQRLADVAYACRIAVDYLVRLNGVDGIHALFEPADFVRPVGVHVSAATNIVGEPALAAEFEARVWTAAKTLAVVGHRATLVDLGGGFAAPFARPGDRGRYPRLRASLVEVLDRALPGWRVGEPVVAFESGRYLTADSGTLLTTVLDVQRSRGNTYVVLDAGANGDCAQVGPLCAAPAVGDVLLVPNVGAYGLSAGFLSRPSAAEIVLGPGDEVLSVRRTATVHTFQHTARG